MCLQNVVQKESTMLEYFRNDEFFFYCCKDPIFTENQPLLRSSSVNIAILYFANTSQLKYRKLMRCRNSFARTTHIYIPMFDITTLIEIKREGGQRREWDTCAWRLSICESLRLLLCVNCWHPFHYVTCYTFGCFTHILVMPLLFQCLCRCLFVIASLKIECDRMAASKSIFTMV